MEGKIMKNYKINEFAETLGISKVTVGNWIKSGVVVPKQTETGQAYFTEEQVASMFVNYRMKQVHKNKSSLYIVCESDEEKIKSLVEVCVNNQKQVYPDSLFVEDFTTFFVNQFANSVFDPESESDLRVLKGYVLKELSTRLADYVKTRVETILNIDETYEKEFTYFELKSLVLNDKNNLTEELIERFDNVAKKISENPTEKNMNLDGSMKLTKNITYGYLKLMIDNKVFDLASKLGLDGQQLKNTNYRQLLNLNEVIDKETYDILANEDFQINLKAPFVNTIIKDILLKTKREIAKTKIIQLAEQGYYHIFRFVDTPECKITLVNYLKDKAFKNVYVLGSDSDKLPNDMVLYLDACKADGTLNYDII